MFNSTVNAEARQPSAEPQPDAGARRVLIANPIDDEGIDLLRQHASVDVETDLSEGDLVSIVPGYDALVVRSGTQVTSRVIAAGDRLQIIGRAGVGADNIDLGAATRRGVVVVNAPTANTIAAAEHAVALMLALARNIPQAHASLRRGRWNRSHYVGVEVRDKVLGIVGLGRIGTAVAKRVQGLGMEVLTYDPYVPPEHAAHQGAHMVPLEELLRNADFITLHTPLTNDTKGLIGPAELALMKPTARLINAARGGLVDEAGLLQALDEGRLAGAALDVFSEEPPLESALLAHPKVVVTPHLGASTREAQAGVAVAVAEQIIDVFNGRLPEHALNAPIVLPETQDALVPYFDLAERLGRFHNQVAGEHMGRVCVTYSGELADYDTTPLKAALLKGLLEPISEERVNLVNAGLIARRRGLEIIEEKRGEADPFASLIQVAIGSADEKRIVAGTVVRSEPHIVRIDDYWVDFVPQGYFLLCHNLDRPGMIGRIGTILGESDVNIASMQVGRDRPRGRALMVLGLDEPVLDEVREEIEAMPDLYDAVPVRM